MALDVAHAAPGFSEALQLLRKGEKAMLWVPPGQGTGETLVAPAASQNEIWPAGRRHLRQCHEWWYLAVAVFCARSRIERFSSRKGLRRSQFSVRPHLLVIIYSNYRGIMNRRV
jgi:hypothetical protein